MELLILYLGLTVSFFILTFLVFKKESNPSNLAFSISMLGFAINTMIVFIFELINENFLSFSDQSVLDSLGYLGSFIFFLSPLGLLYSGFMIIYGYDAWKRSIISVFSVSYIFIELILLSNEAFDMKYTEIYISSGILNLIVCVPLLSAFYYFSKLLKLIEEKTKVYLLISGLFLGTLGQSFNAANTLAQGPEAVTYLSFAIIIVGVILASFSFTNLSGKIKV